ncbi:BlaI/MecI/CopY family transcriptional regulator [Streptomyces ochraceiscleroticus]|uniref:BlaI/MecI/CopY family transcriptional regulator n=1 Tax=Streptomyces ochraceiscleroticus TaxID=47761 RepID=A0ABW1MP23_9ACTN
MPRPAPSPQAARAARREKGRPEALRAFGELESDIMRVVWASEESLSIQRLTDVLNEERPLAYATVMTVTERLRTKGWLERNKHNRCAASRRWPRMTRRRRSTAGAPWPRRYWRCAPWVSLSPCPGCPR